MAGFVNKLGIFKGQTSDGSTNGVEVYDSAGVLVEKIDTEGFKGIRYRDEYIGGQWALAAAAAAPDEVSYTIGGVGTRKFSFDGNNTEERLSNSFEIPHDLAFEELNAETLFIEAHIHWRPSTNNAGNVEWFLDYSYDGVRVAPVAQTTLTALGEVAANEQFFHKITSFKTALNLSILPKPASGWDLGALISFTLRRTPTGENDTYPDDAILEKVALPVPTYDFGSRQR
jgi:hypothetical protein